MVLDDPISFWGGVDPLTGTIIDRHHPQLGASVAAQVLVLRHGRGSSSSSSVLAECLRLGVGPVAIVLAVADPILALGALVAQELYGTSTPVVVLSSPDYDAFARFPDGAATVEAVGTQALVRCRT